MFSDYSSPATGFTSTWKSYSAGDVVSCQTETDPLPGKKSVETSTNKCIDIATQTDRPNNQKTTTNDEHLAKWLTKMLPMIERELLKGPTRIFEFYDSNVESKQMSGHLSQIVSFEKNEEINKDFNYGTVAWMSIYTENSPMLAISMSQIHHSWCSHNDVVVKFFCPRRVNDGILYEEFKVFPAKTCVQVLSTNNFNRDMIAAGTMSGDLHIWLYEITNDGGNINEMFTDNSHDCSIVGIAWMKTKTFANEIDLLACHKDGHIVQWKIGKQIIREKIFIVNMRSNLTAIAAISNNEFLVGCDDGKIILCSTAQTAAISEKKNLLDPIVIELQSHKFAVLSLHQRKQTEFGSVIISADISGEIYFHQLDDETNDQLNVIKIPLPFKSKIVLSGDSEHILTPGQNGALEIFTISTATQKTIKGNEHRTANAIEISENGLWVVTGCYKGNFQIFRLSYF